MLSTSARSVARPPVLVFGGGAPGTLKSIAAAAEQASLTTLAEASLREADRWLEDNRPLAIVVGLHGAEQACLHFRYNPALAGVPIVGLVDVLGGLQFEEFFGWGGDDITTLSDVSPLVRRLRALAVVGEAPPVKRRGIAIVADPDRRWRVLTARVLRGAGWDVMFALDADEALREAIRPGVELVISSGRIEPDEGAIVAARARASGIAAPWVMAVTPREAARTRAAAKTVANVAVYDAFGPPENVLFVANELIRSGGPEGRASARLLYGTSIRFRAAGTDSDEVGYSYNVSAGGLYVRTLAPLPRGADAWLEFRPPRCDRNVRIEGRVVWARAFGTNDAATVPPGFGIQITGGSVADLERFLRGYKTFASEMLAS